MTQNIYDQPEFFKGYSQLGRSVAGLDGAAEWPALRALLPELRGLRIVDLGCGFGWFCRWARTEGAASVLGLDVSEAMLARAKAATTDAAIRYVRADLERLDLADASFELAYSSLAFHYVEHLAGVFATVRRALTLAGGWSFRSSIRSTWRLPFPAGRLVLTAARSGRWTGISGKVSG